MIYLSEHKYAVGIGLLLAVVGIIFGVFTWVFPFSTFVKKAPEVIDGISGQTESVIENKILADSIFDLVKKISLESTTLAKQNLIKKYNGLSTEDLGYIKDIKESQLKNNELSFEVDIVQKADFLNQENIQNKVVCIFSKDWEQSLNSVRDKSQIKFSGIIVGGKNYTSPFFKEDPDFVLLDECRLIK